jgi:PST family polysaccharide transporter
MFGIIVSMFFLLFSDKIILTLYGSAYIEASKLLKLIIWSGIFMSVEIITGYFLRIQNLTKYVLYSTIWGAVPALIITPIFIKIFGIYGSAYALIISTFSSSILFMLFYKETKHMFFIALESILFISQFKRIIKLLVR